MAGLISQSVTSCCTKPKRKNARYWAPMRQRFKKGHVGISTSWTLFALLLEKVFCSLFDKNDLSRCQQNKAFQVCQFCSASVWLTMWVHALLFTILLHICFASFVLLRFMKKHCLLSIKGCLILTLAWPHIVTTVWRTWIVFTENCSMQLPEATLKTAPEQCSDPNLFLAIGREQYHFSPACCSTMRRQQIQRRLTDAEMARGVGMLEAGLSQQQVAQALNVNQSVISRMWKRYQKKAFWWKNSYRHSTGRPVPCHAGLPAPLLDRYSASKWPPAREWGQDFNWNRKETSSWGWPALKCSCYPHSFDPAAQASKADLGTATRYMDHRWLDARLVYWWVQVLPGYDRSAPESVEKKEPAFPKRTHSPARSLRRWVPNGVGRNRCAGKDWPPCAPERHSDSCQVPWWNPWPHREAVCWSHWAAVHSHGRQCPPTQSAPCGPVPWQWIHRANGMAIQVSRPKPDRACLGHDRESCLCSCEPASHAGRAWAGPSGGVRQDSPAEDPEPHLFHEEALSGSHWRSWMSHTILTFCFVSFAMTLLRFKWNFFFCAMCWLSFIFRVGLRWSALKLCTNEILTVRDSVLLPTVQGLECNHFPLIKYICLYKRACLSRDAEQMWSSIYGWQKVVLWHFFVLVDWWCIHQKNTVKSMKIWTPAVLGTDRRILG